MRSIVLTLKVLMPMDKCVCVCVSYAFPLSSGMKQGDALSPLLLNIVYKTSLEGAGEGRGAEIEWATLASCL